MKDLCFRKHFWVVLFISDPPFVIFGLCFEYNSRQSFQNVKFLWIKVPFILPYLKL